MAHGTRPRRLFVIDDDELSRAVLELTAAEAGFETAGFESGEDALATLSIETPPFAILADMQMPGISGDALGERLRLACGPGTVLLAMSGSDVGKDRRAEFDGFLLKPFTADDLRAACERTGTHAHGAEPEQPDSMLNEAVYRNFARGMPAAQVAALYTMCLADAAKRLETMREAVDSGDDAGYRRAAHAIKGSCGMVGAVELAALAAEMETEGLRGVQDRERLDRFVNASARLGRMLENKVGPA